ncbi:hypothetical protein AVU38_gp157 [Ralstonia phage RSL2]|uniref:DUF4376 domain-containing protein n=1 Tax=Ralstonia phage RSL2 TaxID=1585840 RepID=A0A0A8J8E0_9CAUD|nr:hypothetical protein AVU38_gp157 [Ralstonia phage RSL2]BAQ02685.1 hypothetical protein [Ralstonia phage RSL2]
MATINASTRLVKIGAAGQPNTYPVYMGQVRLDNPNISFPDETDESYLNGLGYFVVQDVAAPTADVVSEGDPVFANGVWSQNWNARAYTADELANALSVRKTGMLEEIATKVTAAIEKGFSFAFTDVAGHVQLRDGDRANIASARIRAEALIAKGTTDPVMPFRDWENVTHMCTPTQIVSLSDAAYDAYLGFLGAGWTLKDAVTNAATAADLPTIPAEITLPA